MPHVQTWTLEDESGDVLAVCLTGSKRRAPRGTAGEKWRERAIAQDAGTGGSLSTCNVPTCALGEYVS